MYVPSASEVAVADPPVPLIDTGDAAIAFGAAPNICAPTSSRRETTVATTRVLTYVEVVATESPYENAPQVHVERVRPDVSSARGHCRAGYGIARRACDREGGRG